MDLPSSSASRIPISIIFLDIDGVVTKYLKTQERHKHLLPYIIDRGYKPTDQLTRLQIDQLLVKLFSNEAILNLDHLISNAEWVLNHEIGIVVSSDWRVNRSIEFLKKMFSKFQFSKKIIDKTPKLFNTIRSEEVIYWLNYQLYYNNKYEIKSFVILDDRDYGFSLHFPDNFVHCNNTTLFDLPCYEKALHILTEKSLETSEKTVEMIREFRYGSYIICKEQFESIANLDP